MKLYDISDITAALFLRPSVFCIPTAERLDHFGVHVSLNEEEFDTKGLAGTVASLVRKYSIGGR